MHIEKISLVNYKNYADCSVQFNAKINCLVGNNGSGKTNLLDAIYYLCMCKSYFNSTEAYNFKYETDFIVIQGNFINNGASTEIYCGVKKGKKKIFRKNKKEYQTLAEHVGNYPVVMVSPADSGLILDGSDERRRYINSVVSQYNREYLEKTIQYGKVLAQRNKFLKESQFGPFNHELLEVYNNQLIPLGEYIYKHRKDFVEQLIPVFRNYYKVISENKEEVHLHYESMLSNDDFSTLLKNYISRDTTMMHTSAGVHKDDIVLTMNNVPIKKAASQGQQKTFLTALKMAQFEFLRGIKKIKPILLLDDIFDKFDACRVKQILKLVSGDDFGQIIISHHNEQSMLELLKDINAKASIFRIANNQIETVL